MYCRRVFCGFTRRALVRYYTDSGSKAGAPDAKLPDSEKAPSSSTVADKKPDEAKTVPKPSLADAERQGRIQRDLLESLMLDEDEGFGEGFLPNEWEDGDFDNWTKGLEKKGTIPGKSNPKSKEFSEAYHQWAKLNHDNLVQKEAATLAKAVIMNTTLKDFANESQQRPVAEKVESDPMLSLMDKLEAGRTDFTAQEQSILDRLKVISLQSERRVKGR